MVTFWPSSKSSCMSLSRIDDLPTTALLISQVNPLTCIAYDEHFEKRVLVDFSIVVYLDDLVRHVLDFLFQGFVHFINNS